MAKKKQPTKLHFLAPPYSAKAIVGTVIVFTGLLMINITSLHRYKQEEAEQAAQASKNILSQMGKQNILGSSTSGNTVDEDANFKKRTDVNYWLTVLSQRPDYRDAHVILAVLAYNDHRCKFATEQLEEAYQIDPKVLKEMPLAQAINVCEK